MLVSFTVAILSAIHPRPPLVSAWWPVPPLGDGNLSLGPGIPLEAFPQIETPRAPTSSPYPRSG